MPARLGDHTWRQVDGGQLLVVPLGSVEQHGPHLPLDTDLRIAVAVAERAADAVAGAVVAPPLSYGSSGEHESFPGTLSIGATALELVVTELGRSARRTFARVVFVSGHGGNLRPLTRAVRTLESEGQDVVGWVPVVPGADAHAGWAETSLMLHLYPEQVRLDAAEPGNPRPLSVLLPDIRADSVRAVAPNGVLGDPTTASAERGAALLDTIVGDLLATVRTKPR